MRGAGSEATVAPQTSHPAVAGGARCGGRLLAEQKVTSLVPPKCDSYRLDFVSHPFAIGGRCPPASIVVRAGARSGGHERRRPPARTITDTSTPLAPDGRRPPSGLPARPASGPPSARRHRAVYQGAG